jgi:hypothetical protein
VPPVPPEDDGQAHLLQPVPVALGAPSTVYKLHCKPSLTTLHPGVLQSQHEYRIIHACAIIYAMQQKPAWLNIVACCSAHQPTSPGLQCRGCSAATACSCDTAKTWTRRTQTPVGRAHTAATRCCATAASTAPAAAGPQPAPYTARPSPWVRPSLSADLRPCNCCCNKRHLCCGAGTLCAACSVQSGQQARCNQHAHVRCKSCTPST